MKKQTVKPKQESRVNVKSSAKGGLTREYVDSLRGKFKGKGLLKALMVERKKEQGP